MILSAPCLSSPSPITCTERKWYRIAKPELMTSNNSQTGQANVPQVCRGYTGSFVGHVCSSCEGKCISCEASERDIAACRAAQICRICFQRPRRACVLCGMPGNSLAYYCERCVLLEKDRDGCPVHISE
ncbi:Chromosome segregation ATPase [Giardia duodenalis assemblage B]|uniref:Chromosome segregation ATPase n=1 Tax=Giardia duodenalis assemblage B TaxID=1394984 RepID=A0A132NQS9_GIAIN|nr:Chromosome segregation ATPase [Giardia intestinalis assemblage B]